jgi:hypothetical protein
MGRTVPSITQVFMQEEKAFARFRRALRREDQLALDDLFASAQKHLAEVAYAGHSLPFEAMLLAMLLEEHKLVLHLRGKLETLLERIPLEQPRIEIPPPVLEVQTASWGDPPGRPSSRESRTPPPAPQQVEYVPLEEVS